MPTVQYQPDQVRTEVAGRTQARTVANGGQQLAKGIDSLAQMAGEMKRKATVAEAQEAATGFERDKNNLFFNPDNGYFNTQGRTAYDSADSTSKELEKLKEQYASKLNPMARQEFERVAGAQITRSNADIMRHSSKNLQAWEQANIHAEIENSLENSALNWNVPENLDLQMELGLQSVNEAAKIQGLSPEATNEKVENFYSAFASNVIKAAAQSSPAEGDAAMEKWGKMLEGPDKVNMQEMLTKRTEAEKIKDISREAVLKGTNLVRDLGDRNNARAAILEEVDKIKDADARKATKSQAMYQLNLKMQADAESRGEIFKTVERMKYDGESIEKFKSESSEMWNKLSTSQKQAIESVTPIKTDPNTWINFKLMDRDELAEVDPTQYATKLASNDLYKLADMVKEAREAENDDIRVKSSTGRTRAQMTKSVVTQLFGDINKNNEDKVRAFDRLIDTEVRRIEFQTGKEMTSVEYNDLISNITRMTFIDKGYFYDSEENLDELSAEETRRISQLLLDNNVAVTEANIRQAYKDIQK